MSLTRLAFLKQATAAGALLVLGFTPKTVASSTYGNGCYGTATYERHRPRHNQ